MFHRRLQFTQMRFWIRTFPDSTPNLFSSLMSRPCDNGSSSTRSPAFWSGLCMQWQQGKDGRGAAQYTTFGCSHVDTKATRYTPHPNGYQAAVKLSEEFATRARVEIDLDEPCIDSLQACLLLVIAFIAAGKGKKAYMLLSRTPLILFPPPLLSRAMHPQLTSC